MTTSLMKNDKWLRCVKADQRWPILEQCIEEYNIVSLDWDFKTMGHDRMYEGNYTQHGKYFEVEVFFVECESTRDYYDYTNNDIGSPLCFSDDILYATLLHEIGHCVNNLAERTYLNLYEEEKAAWAEAALLDKELFKDQLVLEWVKVCLSSYQSIGI